tara:strand:- start:7690 stop:8640 length:951 start_codon:yes stop_codon:yes gene_type:complete
MHKIYPLIKSTNFPYIERNSLKTIQVNLGYKCNQRCVHCHVNAGPNRKEMMDKKTIDNVIDFCVNNEIQAVDLTGGAPEINKHFKYIIQKLFKKNIHIINRCNLTILEEEGMDELLDFFPKYKVELIASLPCYSQSNVDAQRGKGVFDKSIRILKKLNNKGYGESKSLLLNLVYNPQGAVLPPQQDKLQDQYKILLKNNFNIEFNSLYTITNMPISRFGSTLISKGIFDDYVNLLKDSYSEQAKNNVMCKNLISIDYDGYVYDCDFNQMLNIPLSNKKIHITDIKKEQLYKKEIATGDHCYGCTAGDGSSCGGSLT